MTLTWLEKRSEFLRRFVMKEGDEERAAALMKAGSVEDFEVAAGVIGLKKDWIEFSERLDFKEINASLWTEVSFEDLQELEADIALFLKYNKRTKRMVKDVDKQWDLIQLKFAAKRLTEIFGIPVYLNLKPSTCGVGGFNRYGDLKFKVIAELNRQRKRYEQWRAYYRMDENRDDVKQYTVLFAGEKAPFKWTKDAEATLMLSRFVYLAQVELDDKTESVYVLADVNLRVGGEYKSKGLVFEVATWGELKWDLPSKQLLAIVDEVVDDEAPSIPESVFVKSKGKSFEWFQDSVLYPYHHVVKDLGELATVSCFHVYSGFPFNVMFVGPAGFGKTATAEKIRVAAGEPLYSGGSTVKGIMPSFSNNNASGGTLANARYKACVNEFFSLVEGLPPSERPMALSRLKDILEGRECKFVSGNGEMMIKMTADLFATSNPPHKRDGEEMVNVFEMYDFFDKALLDRILFYWVTPEQHNIVDEWKSEAAEVEASVKFDLSLVDYELLGLLTPVELRRVMGWLKQVPFRYEDSKDLKKQARDLVDGKPSEYFSRSFEFMQNMASGYAVIRGLSEGTLREVKEIVVLRDDVHRAKAFLLRLLGYYGGVLNARHTAQAGLTAFETQVLGLLKWKADNSEGKFSVRVQIKDLTVVLGEETRIRSALAELARKKLAVFDDSTAAWLPDLSDYAYEMLVDIHKRKDVAVDDLLPPIGAQKDDPKAVAGYLFKHGLVSRNLDRYGAEWKSLEENVEASQNARPRPKIGICDFVRSFPRNEEARWCTRRDLNEAGFSDELIDQAVREGALVNARSGKFITAVE